MFAFKWDANALFANNLIASESFAARGQFSTTYALVRNYISISKNPCEFSAAIEAAGCGMAARGGDSQLFYGPPGLAGTHCAIDSTKSGGVIYMNVRNSDTRDGPDNCPEGVQCEYFMSW